MTAAISVSLSERLDVGEYLTVMEGSGLAERRPYADLDRVGNVLAASTPVVRGAYRGGHPGRCGPVDQRRRVRDLPV